MKIYLLKNDSRCSQSFFNYNPTNSNNKKSYQSYYCLDSRQGTISPPSELIQKCIKHLTSKGKKPKEEEVTEIVLDRFRYFISTDKALLELTKTGSYDPDVTYQYRSIMN